MKHKFFTILLAVVTVSFLSMMPVLAEDGAEDECCYSNDIITTENCAMVMNDVVAVAKTGDNTAEGSYGGSGGEGGNILNSGDDVENSMTGAGGAGGGAGVGGTITTGSATAAASLNNDVNSTDIAINRCGCEGSTTTAEINEECNSRCGDSVLATANRAMLMSRVKAIADTGENLANGSYGGAGGRGGKIENQGGEDVEGSTTGAGGAGGSSIDGGLVQTGMANSASAVVNVVNRSLIRINR